MEVEMINVYMGKSYKQKPTGELLRYEFKDFQDFCEKMLDNCKKGPKNQDYFVIGDEYSVTPGDKTAHEMSYKRNYHYHRNNESQGSAQFICFDGDTSKDNPGGCINPQDVSTTLMMSNYKHAIYTTHSHIKGVKNRWRLVMPCRMNDVNQLKPTLYILLELIQQNGCPALSMSNESNTWTQPWYLPTSYTPETFEFYAYFEGNDFEAADPASMPVVAVAADKAAQTSAANMMQVIISGSSPLHESILKFAWGSVRDGRQPTWIKAELHALTAHYSPADARLQARKADIDRIVDESYAKRVTISDEWSGIVDDDNDRFYTRYPDQGGVFEQMVQVCMRWMYYPNRQIAVATIHALISTLGGRVYSFAKSGGIVYTALVTGRSTIGKSNIKKFCVFVLNNSVYDDLAKYYIGSHFYTSAANLIKELKNTGTLLSVRTESGQSDQSTAGDMKRVMLYELELATESGRGGYVSPGGQNEKIPALFSPAVTTVRESVQEIQSEADLINKAAVAGLSGRRSHVIIDPFKSNLNENKLTVLPDWFRGFVKELHMLAIDQHRTDVEKKVPDDAWITINFEDYGYFRHKMTQWIEKENQFALNGNHFEATFFGRMGEKVPAYSGRLAVSQNPHAPIITNLQIDIAEESLTAEVFAHSKQNDFQSPWDILIKKIVKLFHGDMTKNAQLIKSKRTTQKMLAQGALEWRDIYILIYRTEEYKILSAKDNFERTLTQKLEYNNIHLLEKEVTVRMFGKRAKIYQRG
jgi:hypothetical protein